MLYRVIKDLNTGHKAGDLVDGRQFKFLDMLVQKGALVEAKAPPLTELPGWKTKAAKLARIGIMTIHDLIDMDPKRGTKLFRHKRESTFVKWVEEARGWLLAPKPKSG